MNRNTEAHFANYPNMSIPRSKFDRSFTHKTTFDTGELIPIYCDCTILPGDTVKMRTANLIRMMTPLTPVMDNCYMDTYFFFVPYRLIWDHFKEFMGENTSAPWTQQTEYEIPQIVNLKNNPDLQFKTKSLADYFGYPITGNTTKDWKASVLPFRAYCLIWNEWFRSEALQNPVNVLKDDVEKWTLAYDAATYNEIIHEQYGGGKPLKVCKPFDYFTGALPQPQKGPAVTVPSLGAAYVRFGTYGQEPNPETDYGPKFLTTGSDGVKMKGWQGEITTDTTPAVDDISFTSGSAFYPYADLSSATMATINELRQAFAVQKFYERQARGGTRYIEMVKSHFNVTNPDFRVQRPEYLGGKRTPINMNQVVQTSATGITPMGDTAGYSVTAETNEDLFTHSFTEHGILMGLCCVRTDHTYQQGLNRQYSMKKMTDFYFPEFANLGEQAILNKEIYLQGKDEDEEAFGYQEAWANYRYMPSIVTGEMRSSYAQSLDVWHYADDYSQLPSLGDTWIQETKDNVKRTLAVQTHNQFEADFYFGSIYTRPMPLYSIPGLIDHH